MLHQPQNTNSSRDMRDNTIHMVCEGELSVKLHSKNVEAGTSANGNPTQDQVSIGQVIHDTVLDLLITKALVLLETSIMHSDCTTPKS